MDDFLSVRDRTIFIGRVRQVQNAMGRTIFFPFKHGADTFFNDSSDMGWTLFALYSANIKLVKNIVRNCGPSAII